MRIMEQPVYEAIIRELLYLVDIQRRQIIGLNAMVQKGVKLPNQNQKIPEGEITWPESMLNSEQVKDAVFRNLFKGMEERSPNGEVDRERLIYNMIKTGLFKPNEATNMIMHAIGKGRIIETREGIFRVLGDE